MNFFRRGRGRLAVSKLDHEHGAVFKASFQAPGHRGAKIKFLTEKTGYGETKLKRLIGGLLGFGVVKVTAGTSWCIKPCVDEHSIEVLPPAPPKKKRKKREGPPKEKVPYVTPEEQLKAREELGITPEFIERYAPLVNKLYPGELTKREIAKKLKITKFQLNMILLQIGKGDL
jgi:hypothetical protein